MGQTHQERAIDEPSMGVEGEQFRRFVRYAIIATVVAPFIGGPSVAIGPLDIILFDMSFAVLCLAFLQYLLANFSSLSLTLPRSRLLLAAAGIYLTLAIGFPVAGQVVFGHPIKYFVGDLRWVQVLVIVGIALSLYDTWETSLLFKDIERALKVLVVIHVVLFGIQLVGYLGVADTGWLVELWNYNQSPDSPSGFREGRFIAAALTPSLLGLSVSVAIVFFAVTAIRRGTNLLYLLVAITLLLASGHRTSMVGVAGSALVIVAYFALYYRSDIAISLRHIGASLGAIALGGYLVTVVDFGGRGDRFEDFVDILTGRESILEASDRGSRWGSALDRAAEYPFGTFSNPSWVFQDLEPVDSYFVMAYIQGSWPFLASYLFLLAALGTSSLRLLTTDSRAMIPFALLLIIGAQSLMQNFMTSIAGKMTLMLTLLLTLYLCLDQYDSSYTITA